MALPDKILARKLKKKEKKKQQLLQEKKEDVNTSVNGNLLLKKKIIKGKIWTKKVVCSSITICPFIFNFDNNFDKLWF